MKLYYLRLKNVNKQEAIKKLKALNAKYLSTETQLQMRFKLEQSKHLQNKIHSKLPGYAYLTLNSGKNTPSITFEEGDFEGKDTEQIAVNVDDFFKAAKVLIKTMPKNDFDYTELNREIYWYDDTTIILEEMPSITSVIILSSPNKKKTEEVRKKLGIKGTLEPNFNIKSAERYYTLHGVDYDIVKTIFKRRLHKKLGITNDN